MKKFIKTHWLKLCLLFTLVIVAGVFGYLFVNKNIGINREYLLRKSVKQYADLIDVGLSEQAFNEFLTPAAKAKIEIRDISTPDRERQSKCPTGIDGLDCFMKAYIHTKVEVTALENFKSYCDRRKNNWQNYRVDKIVFSGNNRADIRFTYTENGQERNAPETWYYQNGKWLRDF